MGIDGARAGRARTGGRLAVVASAAFLIATLLPALAWADGEESDRAPVLVTQAIALIVNEAGDERVAERIQDALDAPEREGVEVSDVQAALALIEQPGEDPAVNSQAEALLLGSIGGRLAADGEESAGADESGGSPRYATGVQTGTTVILAAFIPARGVADLTGAVLVAGSLAAIVGGLVLSRRFRPPHRLRDLKRRTLGQGGA